jgi:uncharacterized membrane protein
MGHLLVITFERRESAAQARDRLKGLEGSDGGRIDDVAVVEKDAEGTIHVQHGFDRATAGGAVIGGALGLLLALVFFPVAGLAAGAVVGGLIGRSLHQDIDRSLVDDVTRDLTADTSALFVMGSGNAAAIVGALGPYKGRVYQTTLDPDTEAQIQAALDREG